ncbi:MAG: alkylphosphonate utilization protein [Comamonas sp.]|nr:alkylphosphonate utilization protein [Comamonas sp.]
MSTSSFPSCPQCGLDNTYPDGELFICPDCAHEWSANAADSSDEDGGPRIIKDANGTPLADGDTVLLIKDLKVKGSSTVLKKGSKIKGIRLVYDNGDHDVDCKTEQGPFTLKSEFLKKA